MSVIDKFKLYSEIRSKVTELMMSPKFGFSEEEAQKFAVVKVDETDESYRVEVNSMISPNGMKTMSSILNTIIAQYDEEAYFDMLDIDIIEAHIKK